MRTHVTCGHCGNMILDGEEYIFDDYYEVPFCDTDCGKEHFGDNIDRMYEQHKEFYVYDQDYIT